MTNLELLFFPGSDLIGNVLEQLTVSVCSQKWLDFYDEDAILEPEMPIYSTNLIGGLLEVFTVLVCNREWLEFYDDETILDSEMSSFESKMINYEEYAKYSDPMQKYTGMSDKELSKLFSWKKFKKRTNFLSDIAAENLCNYLDHGISLKSILPYFKKSETLWSTTSNRFELEDSSGLLKSKLSIIQEYHMEIWKPVIILNLNKESKLYTDSWIQNTAHDAISNVFLQLFSSPNDDLTELSDCIGINLVRRDQQIYIYVDIEWSPRVESMMLYITHMKCLDEINYAFQLACQKQLNLDCLPDFGEKMFQPYTAYDTIFVFHCVVITMISLAYLFEPVYKLHFDVFIAITALVGTVHISYLTSNFPYKTTNPFWCCDVCIHGGLHYGNWQRWFWLSVSQSICVTYVVVMELFNFSILHSIPFICYAIAYPFMVATIMGDRFYQYHLLTVLLIVISMPGASYGILTFFDAKVSISLYPWIICAILEALGLICVFFYALGFFSQSILVLDYLTGNIDHNKKHTVLMMARFEWMAMYFFVWSVGIVPIVIWIEKKLF